jgi:REP element-mobilizing transposase RayT
MARLAATRNLAVRAWCIMPDHIHVVVETMPDADVEGWVRYFKRSTARLLGAAAWQRSYWDRDVRHDEDAGTVVGYILANPVRAGLVDRPEDWPHAWSEWHQHE